MKDKKRPCDCKPVCRSKCERLSGPQLVKRRKQMPEHSSEQQIQTDLNKEPTKEKRTCDLKKCDCEIRYLCKRSCIGKQVSVETENMEEPSENVIKKGTGTKIEEKDDLAAIQTPSQIKQEIEPQNEFIADESDEIENQESVVEEIKEEPSENVIKDGTEIEVEDEKEEDVLDAIQTPSQMKQEIEPQNELIADGSDEIENQGCVAKEIKEEPSENVMREETEIKIGDENEEDVLDAIQTPSQIKQEIEPQNELIADESDEIENQGCVAKEIKEEPSENVMREETEIKIGDENEEDVLAAILTPLDIKEEIEPQNELTADENDKIDQQNMVAKEIMDESIENATNEGREIQDEDEIPQDISKEVDVETPQEVCRRIQIPPSEETKLEVAKVAETELEAEKTTEVMPTTEVTTTPDKQVSQSPGLPRQTSKDFICEKEEVSCDVAAPEETFEIALETYLAKICSLFLLKASQSQGRSLPIEVKVHVFTICSCKCLSGTSNEETSEKPKDDEGPQGFKAKKKLVCNDCKSEVHCNAECEEGKPSMTADEIFVDIVCKDCKCGESRNVFGKCESEKNNAKSSSSVCEICQCTDNCKSECQEKKTEKEKGSDNNKDNGNLKKICEKCICSGSKCNSECEETKAKLKTFEGVKKICEKCGCTGECSSECEKVKSKTKSSPEPIKICEKCGCTGECSPDCEEVKSKTKPSPEAVKICEKCGCTGECSPECEKVKSKTKPSTEAVKICEKCGCSGECSPECEKVKSKTKSSPEPIKICEKCGCTGECSPECEEVKSKTKSSPEAVKICEKCDCTGKCSPECEEIKSKTKSFPEVVKICEKCGCTGKCTPECEEIKSKTKSSPEAVKICEKCGCAGKCTPECEEIKSKTKSFPEAVKICEKCGCTGKCTPECEDVKSKIKSAPEASEALKICEKCGCTGKCSPECEDVKSKIQSSPEAVKICVKCDCPGKCSPECEEVKSKNKSLPEAPEAVQICEKCGCTGKCSPECEDVKSKIKSSSEAPGAVKICEKCGCPGKCSPECEDEKSKMKSSSEAVKICEECGCPGKCSPKCEDIKSKIKSSPGAPEALKICEKCGCPGKCSPECEDVKSKIKSSPGTPEAVKICENCGCIRKCNPECEEVKSKANFSPETANICEKCECTGICIPECETVKSQIKESTKEVKNVCEKCECIGICLPECEENKLDIKTSSETETKSKTKSTEGINKICNKTNCTGKCLPKVPQKQKDNVVSSYEGIKNKAFSSIDVCKKCVCDGECTPECQLRKAELNSVKLQNEKSSWKPNALTPYDVCDTCKCTTTCNTHCEATKQSKGMPKLPTTDIGEKSKQVKREEERSATTSILAEYTVIPSQKKCPECLPDSPCCPECRTRKAEDFIADVYFAEKITANHTDNFEIEKSKKPFTATIGINFPATSNDATQMCNLGNSILSSLGHRLINFFLSFLNIFGFIISLSVRRNSQNVTSLTNEPITNQSSGIQPTNLDKKNVSSEANNTDNSSCFANTKSCKSADNGGAIIAGMAMIQNNGCNLFNAYIKKASLYVMNHRDLDQEINMLKRRYKEKDDYIAALTEDLVARSDSSRFESLRKKMNNNFVADVPDFDRNVIASLLSRKPITGCKSICGIKPTTNYDIYEKDFVDTTPFNITWIKRVGIESLLINWKAPFDKRIIAYEIYVQNKLKVRIFDCRKNYTTLNSVDLSHTIEIKIYAVTKNGRIPQPAIAYYAV